MEFLDDSEWSGEDEDSDFEEDLLKDKGEEEELQMMRTAMKKRSQVISLKLDKQTQKNCRLILSKMLYPIMTAIDFFRITQSL